MINPLLWVLNVAEKKWKIHRGHIFRAVSRAETEIYAISFMYCCNSIFDSCCQWQRFLEWPSGYEMKIPLGIRLWWRLAYDFVFIETLYSSYGVVVNLVLRKVLLLPPMMKDWRERKWKIKRGLGRQAESREDKTRSKANWILPSLPERSHNNTSTCKAHTRSSHNILQEQSGVNKRYWLLDQNGDDV